MAGMSRKELLDLPVTVDLATAAKALGIGRDKAQRLARDGDFPCGLHRLGKSWRVVTQGPSGLLAACGITAEEQAAAAARVHEQLTEPPRKAAADAA